MEEGKGRDGIGNSRLNRLAGEIARVEEIDKPRKNVVAGGNRLPPVISSVRPQGEKDSEGKQVEEPSS